LDAETRAFFEPRFGRQFGDVRVHTDAKSAESARAVNARAYTVGRQVVFGAEQYRPHTDVGRALLAHELAHTMQQGGETGPANNIKIGSSDDRYESEADHLANRLLNTPVATGASNKAGSTIRDAGRSAGSISSAEGPRLQRLPLTDTVSDFLSNPLVQQAGGALAKRASNWLADPRNRQIANDLEASVREAPAHAGEILAGELWDAIQKHMDRVVVVTLAFVLAEEIIADLVAAPEPLVTKVIAAILQVLVIAVLGYFAYAEVEGAYDEGMRWISQAREANGNPAAISEASRSFLRMVRHIILAILVIAGVRARVRGFTGPKGAPAAGGGASSGASGGAGEAAAPKNVTPISTHPNYRPNFGSSPSAGPRASSGSAFEGSTARQLAPAEQPLEPLPAEVEPAPAPAPAEASGAAPAGGGAKGPGVQPVPAGAAGVASATRSATRRKKLNAYPLCWAQQLGPPMFMGVPVNLFTRTTGVERDTEDQDQRRLALRARGRLDPNFNPEDYHIHHSVPLFLGGVDAAEGNLVVIPRRLHLRGHAALRYQPQMETPPPPLAPLPKDLLAHPPGTVYELVGYKGAADEVCQY
jgi:hypothetical protein